MVPSCIAVVMFLNVSVSDWRLPCFPLSKVCLTSVPVKTLAHSLLEKWPAKHSDLI